MERDAAIHGFFNLRDWFDCSYNWNGDSQP